MLQSCTRGRLSEHPKERLTESSQPRTDTQTLLPASYTPSVCECTASSASPRTGSLPCSHPLSTCWNNWRRQDTARIEKPQRGRLLAEAQKSGYRSHAEPLTQETSPLLPPSASTVPTFLSEVCKLQLISKLCLKRYVKLHPH